MSGNGTHGLISFRGVSSGNLEFDVNFPLRRLGCSMSLATLQKAAAQAIVNIFETGSVRGNYGDVTLLPGDSGQLTYGRSQTALASGNLFLLIQAYCARTDAQFGATMKSYLASLEACDRSLNYDAVFRALLKDAGDDPVMQELQDAFFDSVYWDPAVRSAKALGAVSALGTAIIYDSSVHGSWAHVRDLTRRRFGELIDIGEDEWMQRYIETRREWLADNANPLLHKTVYRMDAFKAIVDHRNWKLELPLNVRGLAVTADSLNAAAPVSIPADPAPRRILALKRIPMTGTDVSWLQDRLTAAGLRTPETGTFDAVTEQSVRDFQKIHHLKVDGVVGPATRSALEDVPVISQSKSEAAIQPMPAVPQSSVSSTQSSAAGSTSATTRPIGGDAAADIKRHISSEVHSAVQQLQSSLRDDQRLPPGARPSLIQRALRGTQKSRGLLLKHLVKGHPGWAAALSTLLLILTETRDALAWFAAGPFTQAIRPIIPSNLPSLPQSSADVPRFVAQGHGYLQTLAASVPNEWLFRTRIAALVLVGYALFRLLARRVDVNALEHELEEAHVLATDVQAAAK